MGNYEILCEVIEVDTGRTKCSKVGDVFVIGLRTPAGMCCRAFHAVYPTALAMRFSDKMKWEADDGSVCVKCPDNNVLYRLTRTKEIT